MTTQLIGVDALHEFVRDVFLQLDCAEQSSMDAADVLTWASLRGVDTHGIRNLVPYYVNNIRNGQIDPRAVLSIEQETDGAARANGGSGLGLAGAASGMRLAIEKAESHGIGMVAIHNMHHLGPAGYYAQLALRHGMLGFCTTGHFFGSGHEVGVAPLNGMTPMFSTNPISFAAPCRTNAPFVLDMSTAVTTVNRIEMIGQSGQAIPAGWAKDALGQPTCDPEAAKVLYPLGGDIETGGHKGIGLSMMVAILSSVLSGGWSKLQKGDDYDQPTMGHFFAAVRIDQFMPVDTFTSAMDAFVDSILNCAPVDGQRRIHYPGSQEHATSEERTANGIPVESRLFDELRQLARSLSVSTNIFDS